MQSNPVERLGSFDSLPDETLFHIFTYFSGVELAKNACVCKRFHKISSDESLPTSITFTAVKIIDQMRNVDNLKRVHVSDVCCETPGYLDERGLFRTVADKSVVKERCHSFTLVWGEPWSKKSIDILWFRNESPSPKRGELLLEAIQKNAQKILYGIWKTENLKAERFVDFKEPSKTYHVLSDRKKFPTLALLKAGPDLPYSWYFPREGLPIDITGGWRRISNYDPPFARLEHVPWNIDGKQPKELDLTMKYY